MHVMRWKKKKRKKGWSCVRVLEKSIFFASSRRFIRVKMNNCLHVIYVLLHAYTRSLSFIILLAKKQHALIKRKKNPVFPSSYSAVDLFYQCSYVCEICFRFSPSFLFCVFLFFCHFFFLLIFIILSPIIVT